MELLSSQQKVAEVLLSLSPKDAADTIRKLDEEELLFVGESILKYAKVNSRMNVDPSAIVEQDAHAKQDAHAEHAGENTLQESPTSIESEDKHRKASSKDGKTFLRLVSNDYSEIEVIKALYKIAFGEKYAKELMYKLLRRNLSNRLSFLNTYSATHLHLALHKESNSVIAIVMGVIKPKISAQLIRMFNTMRRQEIITRIVDLKNPSVEAITIIEEVLRRKLSEIVQQEKNRVSLDGEKNLLIILQHLDTKAQDSILAELEDQKMKDRIIYNLFSWRDIECLSQLEIEEILIDFDNKDLAKLILLDGIDATSALATMVSASRLQQIEDEVEYMRMHLITEPHELVKAAEVKKRFFAAVKDKAKFHL